MLMLGVLMIMSMTVFAMAEEARFPSGHERHRVAATTHVHQNALKRQTNEGFYTHPAEASKVDRGSVVAVEDSIDTLDPYPQPLY